MTRGSFTGSLLLKLNFTRSGIIAALVHFALDGVQSNKHQFYGQLLQLSTMWMPTHQVRPSAGPSACRDAAAIFKMLNPSFVPPVASGKQMAANCHPEPRRVD